MKKVLVANRAEIACRVIYSLQRMNIHAVAVYSDADRLAPHVQMADEAYYLGPAPSAESYLLADKIIKIAKDCGADAIHPGYGFLSENANFSESCEAAGITFIGPRAHAIRVMGSKLESKQTVARYDIPLVPGTEHAIEDREAAKKIAEDIGYPILIKASAGGGGKGMRIVNSSAEFEEQMDRAQGEARASFGDDAVFIEKYVASPRHIEVQVIADEHGNVLHLHERECSVQRRHQKVVEEAPSAVLTPALRAEMGAAAVQVAKSCDYVGAGTVEFLLDEQLRFYFLEMNTRLQVEHPVTELITGLDLVELQVKIARGESLPITQDEVQLLGHSIELRVYAEDSLQDFAPSIGTLHRYEEPKGSGVRVDSGYRQGMEIPIYYDPMISKLIVYADTRKQAIALMRQAIKDYEIQGVETTLEFGRYVMDHEAFVSGKFDTHFVKQHYSADAMITQYADEMEAAGAFASWHHSSQTR